MLAKPDSAAYSACQDAVREGAAFPSKADFYFLDRIKAWQLI